MMLTERRFAPLFWTQFFSAFGDNVLKNALVFVILHQMSIATGATLVTAAGGVFIAPFIFLSGLGGELADRFDKGVLTRALKLAELAVAILATVGFLSQSIATLFVALFLYGAIAALFGPIKYGILPDVLRPEELGAGNALIEGATFAAILLGTIVGGLTTQGDASPIIAAALVPGLALLCWVASRFMPPQTPAAPDLTIERNVLRSTGRLLAALLRERPLWRAGLLVSVFWLVGAIVLSLLPPLVKDRLRADDGLVTIFLAVFAVAIGVGSALGARLMGARPDLRLAPAALVAMALFAADIALSLPVVATGVPPRAIAAVLHDIAIWRAAIDLAGLAIAGGVLIVPTFAAVQAWSRPESRARMIGAVNILSAMFMVGGAVVVGALQTLGVSLEWLFAGIGLACVAAAIWSFSIRRTKPIAPDSATMLPVALSRR